MVSKVVAVETRMAIAMARRIDENVSVTVLCKDLGISRQTFYVYARRFERDGLVGLLPMSRAARTHPNAVPVAIADAVGAKRRELLEQGLDGGAASVWGWMTRDEAGPPSIRTIHRIFVRRGLVVPQPQKRPRSSTRRF